MAIQDAVCLSRCLSTSSLAEATKAYEARRRPSCEHIVASSKAMAEANIGAGASRESVEGLLAKVVAVQESEPII